MDRTKGIIQAEDFEDFFETALCGYVLTDGKGVIMRINTQAAKWLSNHPAEFAGKRISDILSIGARIYFETHLWPLLIMQGYFDEVAVELIDTGTGKLPILINAYMRKDDSGLPIFTRFTLFRASDRRLYEQNLQMAKQLAETSLKTEQQNAIVREQFIAVLGHDLRNPLTAIHTVSQILEGSEKDVKKARLIGILKTSVKRMSEMIANVMDFARGRLGGGFSVVFQSTDLENLLLNISEESRIAWPERKIVLDLDIHEYVECDPARIAQLVSNLLANALTHGFNNTPVIVKSITNKQFWEISITNEGNPIPQKDCEDLFHPFYREKSRANQNGLGLGLYIASEIAKAHKGTLTVVSDTVATCFTLRVNIADVE